MVGGAHIMVEGAHIMVEGAHIMVGGAHIMVGVTHIIVACHYTYMEIYVCPFTCAYTRIQHTGLIYSTPIP